jgi:signal transduction histidine kinase
MASSLVVLLAAMGLIGLWVSQQIEEGVVHRTAATTALYVDSLISQPAQDLGTSNQLSAASQQRIDWLLTGTPLGEQVLVFKLWDRDRRIVYSNTPALVGQASPPNNTNLDQALNGEVSSDLGDSEDLSEEQINVSVGNLLEIYSPVRDKSGTVIAVAEFYYQASDLRAEINRAERNSWLVVAGGALLIYVVLGLFILRASRTIATQQDALAGQVERLTDLLGQNDELHERVRGAAARTTALNERFLRRFSSELHDGPAQEISLALLELDHAQAIVGTDGLASDERREMERNLVSVQESLRRALTDVRATSSGLLLPHLQDLTLNETVNHAVRAHRQRTRDAAEVRLAADLPNLPLTTKITAYRVIQEALANASRHAPGAKQTVIVDHAGDRVLIEVRDDGPGFDAAAASNGDRLGLLGMRERVESLGGEFQIISDATGTRISAALPIEPNGDGDE